MMLQVLRVCVNGASLVRCVYFVICMHFSVCGCILIVLWHRIQVHLTGVCVCSGPDMTGDPSVL